MYSSDTGVDPIDVRDAIQLYLRDRENELADSTLSSQRCRLNQFAGWCADRDVTTTDEVTGRLCQQFKLYLRDHYERTMDDGGETGVSPITIRTRLSTLRVFLKFCVSIDAVADTLPEKIVLPQVDRNERYRETTIDPERAKTVVETLQEKYYGRKQHVLFTLLWRVGCRLGATRSLDLEDLDLDNGRAHFTHRPESDTPLKNGPYSERVVAVDERLCGAMETYVDTYRTPVTDDSGREPLFTTTHGRPDISTLRCWAYQAQLPCFLDNECPHDREISQCDDRLAYNRNHCPSTTMPHNVRRGAITQYLSEDVPHRAISDRCDVGTDVLEEHYDQRSEVGKAEQRRDFFQ